METISARELQPLKATNVMEEVKPYIPATRALPEITLKAVILGVILAVLMAGANAYLGLKIGLTVSATIPAAVISMAILRFFRNSNILENNIVQTAASAGEVIAAAVAFTLPALLMMRYWTNFPFFLTTSLVTVGGLFGVLFSIPLRRAFIIEQPLKFPEGIATGEVLKAGDTVSKEGAKDLLVGGFVSALIKFSQSGLMIFEESLMTWTRAGKTVVGLGTGLSVVMIAAGYIVGVEVGVSMLLGNIIVWVMGIPIYGYLHGLPENAATAYDAAVGIWSSKLRMTGVGAMVVGGFWTLIYLIKPIKNAISSSFEMLGHLKLGGSGHIKRTESDIPMSYVMGGIVLLTIPLMLIFHYIMSSSNLEISPLLHWSTIGGMTIASLILGFLGSAIAGYMAGIVGSSNNPLSGITIMVILSISLLLWMFLGFEVDFLSNTTKALAAAGMTIIFGAIVANAASISCDNLQDLKAGQIVGATPWKQQVMLMVGVVAGAIAITPILQVLFEAYGIGDVLPRPGMNPAQALAAPKAALMAAMAQGVFSQSLDWSMIILGGSIAIGVIILDTIMKHRNSRWRFPVLAVALGLYMPMEVVVPLAIGGFIAFFADKKLDKSRATLGVDFHKAESHARRRGLLLCSGLIAGEALVGILLAGPFAAYQSTTIFKIAPEGFHTWAMLMGSTAFIGICLYLYRITTQRKY